MPYILVKSDDDKILIFSIIIAGIFFFYLLPNIDKENVKENFLEEFQNINTISSEFLADTGYGDSELNSIPLEFKSEINLTTDLEQNNNLAHKLECKHECCSFMGNLITPKYLKGKKGLKYYNNFA